MFVKYINKNIQETLKKRERAFAWQTQNSTATNPDELKPKDLMSRTTFVRMCSNKLLDEDNVLIKGGEIDENGEIQFGVQLGDKGAYKSGTGGFKPIAGIKNIEVSYAGGYKALREATVNWVVNSIEDLDRLTPHFLTAGKSVVLDWGWINPKKGITSLSNPFSTPLFIQEKRFLDSTTDIKGVKVDQSIFDNPQQKIQSIGGDYDAIGGTVKNFNYTLRQDGGFDCTTTITAIGANMFEIPIDIDGGGVDLVTAGEPDSVEIGKPLNSLYTGFDSLINTLINLRDIIVYNIFNINYVERENVPSDQELLQNGIKVFNRKSEELRAIVNKDGRGNIIHKKDAITSFDFNKHRIYRDGQYTINVDNKDNPNVILMTRYAGKEKEGKLPLEDIFVTWAWFEDQLLNRYTTFLGGEEDGYGIKMTMRSIDTVLDEEGNPISTEGLQFGNLDSEEKDELEEKYGVDLGLETYNKLLKTPTEVRYNKLMLANEPFKSFILENLPSARNITSSDKFHNFITALKTGGTIEDISNWRKKAFSKSDNSRRGALRNLWVNITEIQEAFGITQKSSTTTGKGSVRPAGSITKAVTNLLKNVNTNFNNPWDYQIVLDPYDSTNLKIVDNNVGGVRSPKYTKFDETNPWKVKDSPGIYKFPSFTIGSIVKNQTLEFKITNAQSLTALFANNTPRGSLTYNGSLVDSKMSRLFDQDKEPIYDDKYLKNLNKAHVMVTKNEDGVDQLNMVPVGSQASNHNSIIGIGGSDSFNVNANEPWYKKWDPNSTDVPVENKFSQKTAISRLEIVGGEIVRFVTVDTFTAQEARVPSEKSIPPKQFEHGEKLPTDIEGKISKGIELRQSTEVVKYYGYSNRSNNFGLRSEARTLVRTKLGLKNPNIDEDILIPAELGLEVDGIGGIVPGDVCQTDYIQPKYNAPLKEIGENAEEFGPLVYFQILELTQKVDSAGWFTEMRTKMRYNAVATDNELEFVTTDSPVKALQKTLMENPTQYEIGSTTIPDGERLPFALPLGEDGLPVEESTLFNQPLSTSGILSLSGPPTSLLTELEPFRPISDLTDADVWAETRGEDINKAFTDAQNEFNDVPDDFLENNRFPDPFEQKPIFTTPVFEYEPITRPAPKPKNYKNCRAIPADGIHVVSSGDTLSKIAKDYCIDLDKILTLNDIPNADNISVGDRIKLTDLNLRKMTITTFNDTIIKVPENDPGLRDANKIVLTAVSEKKSEVVHTTGGKSTFHTEMDKLLNKKNKPRKKSLIRNIWNQPSEDRKERLSNSKLWGKKESEKKELGVINAKKEKAPPVIDENVIKKVEEKFNKFLAAGEIEVVSKNSSLSQAKSGLFAKLQSAAQRAAGISSWGAKYETFGITTIYAELIGSIDASTEQVNNVTLNVFKAKYRYVDSRENGWYIQFGDILGK